jgi:putative oxidoreductase
MLSKKQRIGLFILRFGMGFFLLLWGLDKIFAPESTVMVYKIFYKIPINVSTSFGIGILEIILSIAIILGLWKRLSYGLGLLLHTISTFATYKQLLTPFGQNHLFIAGLPVLAGFIALYLLREEDTLWSLSK